MPRRGPQMKLGFASPFYGKLGVASLPSEVKTIWYSRNDELPERPGMAGHGNRPPKPTLKPPT